MGSGAEVGQLCYQVWPLQAAELRAHETHQSCAEMMQPGEEGAGVVTCQIAPHYWLRAVSRALTASCCWFSSHSQFFGHVDPARTACGVSISLRKG